jgi:hydroxylamine dehydrogenase
MKKRIWYILGGTALGVLVVVTLLATATATRAAPLQATAPTPDPKASQICVDCHGAGTPKIVEQHEKSKHAENGSVTCLDCHAAEEHDWDATEHYGNVTIGTHPTPKDCEPCHEQAVTEFNRSKHAALAMIYFAASFDRNVFEPTIATKHGCQQCHNIGHFWPDGSVGECDACHPKHTFDVAVARNPYTCGECHIGPDHPHIEIWEESKHGNVFLSFPENQYKLGYKTKDYENKPVPFDAPTCTTCHMDAAPGLPATHDVGERMAWETQSPFTIRTTEAWGGGLSWEEKRANMETVCKQCHVKPFIDRYLLEGDLAALQYNEIYKTAKYWLNEMNDAGIILTAGFEGLAPFTVAGYDDVPEEVAYHMWHHEGRRYRHGALMMGADYTQWHGIWDLQKGLVEIIRYAAEHDLPEGEAWLKSDDPDKFWLYPFYDLPGSAWGIDTIAYRKSEEHTTMILANREGWEDYWDTAYANVKAAYEHGLLSDEQWELVEALYADIDRENGQIFDLPALYDVHKAGKATDDEAVKTQVLELKLPGKAGWEYEK